ncbi:DUF1071 domain-containing protein [Flavonifractor sp. An82]|uniref:Sak single strand annealing protein n=1 Tax=Flavonifractor sp. An82 TaxID=1965660 RepID=UPI0013A685D1|nr:DUF1071 domain-containing protein [Flavonifractor sp. An82]
MSTFTVLSEIDITPYLKKKNGMSYLPWSSAWSLVKTRFPDASYEVVKTEDDVIYFTDGKTCWVETQCNLAIKQLDLKERNICKNGDEFYMGDDGQFTMYIDTVRKEFAQSSISTHRWPLEDSIVPMFKKVKNSRP